VLVLVEGKAMCTKQDSVHRFRHSSHRRSVSVFLGLDGSGKSSILRWLSVKDLVPPAPTEVVSTVVVSIGEKKISVDDTSGNYRCVA
jgi:hypothetical protein